MEQSKFYQIKNVTEHEYTLVGCDGSVIIRPIQDIDKTASVFTIKDAKEGDVLAVEPIEGHPSSFIVIYKKQNEEDFDSYCFVGFDGKFYEGENGHSTEDIHPATKEQRDTLMKAMADAGYEWDAEKKELKKIEQKPTEVRTIGNWQVEDAEHTQSVAIDDELAGKMAEEYRNFRENCGVNDPVMLNEIEEAYYEGVISRKPIERKEEDEWYIDEIIRVVNSDTTLYKNQEIVDFKNNLTDWLKHLKDRIQPQLKQYTAWSDEDEKMYRMCIDAVEYYHTPEDESAIREWLKSLKNRVQPQVKELSDEDKDMVRYIGNAITCKESAKYLEEKGIDMIKAHRWLESLEPQPKEWSDEDEEMLDSIIIDVDYIGEFPDYPTKLDCELKDESNAKIKWLKSLKDRIGG